MTYLNKLNSVVSAISLILETIFTGLWYNSSIYGRIVATTAIIRTSFDLNLLLFGDAFLILYTVYTLLFSIFLAIFDCFLFTKCLLHIIEFIQFLCTNILTMLLLLQRLLGINMWQWHHSIRYLILGRLLNVIMQESRWNMRLRGNMLLLHYYNNLKKGMSNNNELFLNMWYANASKI